MRFVEVTCPLTHSNNAPWDQHGDLKRRHAENARITDQPVAALIIDLKRRGLLDDTLVVWAGEMGRTPHSSGTDGRDHHVSGYTIWMAGGGIQAGVTYGATDEMGMSAVENPLDIHDIHATILHQLGLDHEQADVSLWRPRRAPDRRARPRDPGDCVLNIDCPVPKPTTLALLTFAAVGWYLRRRRAA